MFKPTRGQLTSNDKPITQSLFLEVGYSDAAIYTLKDYDIRRDGREILSIKQLYLAMEDTTEYQFANQYFLGWDHWQRICNNKQIQPHVEKWRKELELKLRSVGVQQAIEHAKGGNFQAAKWLVDKGFDPRGKGRPSKAEVEEEKQFQANIANEYGDDIARLRVVT